MPQKGRRNLRRGFRAVLIGPLFQLDSKWLQVLEAVSLKKSDLRIGIDGGVDRWNEIGLPPQAAIGDWDSLKNRDVLRTVPHLSLPVSKARSDLYHSVKAAISAGAGKIICLGVTAGRMDHHLAVLYDLAECAECPSVKDLSAIGPEGRYHFVTQQTGIWRMKMPFQSVVSIFPLGGLACGVDLRGFRYPLRNEMLNCNSQGLSNVTVRREVEVAVRSGRLVVICPKIKTH